MTDSLDISRLWLTGISEQVNSLNICVPYVPLLLKDITAYVQSTDYESNRIRTIQTIGHLQLEENIMKIVDVNVNGIEFPICLNQLPITDIYFNVPRNNCNSIWDYNAVRVYGTLEKKGVQIILNVLCIFEVENAIVSEQMFGILSTLVRKRYNQYFSEVDKVMDLQW